MIYLVFAVLGLHIISLPIIAGVTVFADSDLKIGKIKIALFGIPIFVKHVDVERLTQSLKGRTADNDSIDGAKQPEEKDKSKKKRGGKLKSFLLSFAKHAAMRVRVRQAELSAIIGADDAAVTATAVGTLRIVYSQVCAFFGLSGASADISPDYGAERIYFDFFGIFSLCFADIIVAVCAALFDGIVRKTSKRSKKYANTVTE